MMTTLSILHASANHLSYPDKDWQRRLLGRELVILRAGEALLQEAIAEIAIPSSIAFLSHGYNAYARKLAVSISLLGGMAGEW